MKLRFPTAVTLVALSLALSGCVVNDDEEDGGTVTEVDVTATDFAFEPTTILLDVGTTAEVSFTNNGSVLHSFTVPDFEVEVEAEGGNSQTLTFAVADEPGAYEFFCKYHPNEMTGTISIGGVTEPGDVVDDDDDVETETEVETDTGGTEVETETDTDTDY
ncbi:MAG TPA: cupredoxin domain-containing protein [Actinomycetota bacterium]|nr:cupredoxin domain-containing protein [Actinomycetota bacterium]